MPIEVQGDQKRPTWWSEWSISWRTSLEWTLRTFEEKISLAPTNFLSQRRQGSSTTAARTQLRWTKPWNQSDIQGSGPSRRRPASQVACSELAWRATSKSAAWLHRKCWEQLAAAPAGGKVPTSGFILRGR